jgi:hypothetical protein
MNGDGSDRGVVGNPTMLRIIGAVRGRTLPSNCTADEFGDFGGGQIA